MTRVVMFHRRYLRYAGGHGKVWDYFRHFLECGLYEPRIYFTPDSVFDETNPWRSVPERIVHTWEPENADLLFLEGADWADMPVDFPSTIPILNLIQGVRHANPALPHYGYLRNQAIRICVSGAVADAILATGNVKGPIVTIPNGIEVPPHDDWRVGGPGEGPILVVAAKNPALGAQIDRRLRAEGFDADLLSASLPRPEFLKRLAQAGIAVLIPTRQEGFYMPGLEAMALGTPVIMPDCVGNMEYARHGENCLIADTEGIPAAIRILRSGDTAVRIAAAGAETARRYTLGSEYQRFAALLNNIEELWQQAIAP